MSGGFVLIVGPSGAGKDTLIARAREHLSGDSRFVFPRRVVTRAASRWEDHDTLDEARFEAERGAGRFALSWRAHGLGYAIPGRCLNDARDGHIVICNVSRTVVTEARRHLRAVRVVEVTASERVLALRLAARQRDEDGDLAQRIARSGTVRTVVPDLRIIDESTPEEGAGRLVPFLVAEANRLSTDAVNS